MKVKLIKHFSVILKFKAILLLLLIFQNCSPEQLELNDETAIDQVLITQNTRASITLKNPGFESGKDDWGNSSNFAITSDEHTGSSAAKVTSSSGGIEQSVNVNSNTEYALKAWVKGDGTLSIGGKSIDFDTNSYTQVSISFNSGSSGSVIIKGTRDSGDVRFDDFALESGSSGPVTFSPERHSELAGQTFRLENGGSALWARISGTGDFQDIKMTGQNSTGDWPRWVVEEVNDGGDYYYRFKNVDSNRRFRPKSTSDDGVYTGRASWTGNWTQWMVIEQANNEFILVNKSTGTVLSAGNNTNGSLVRHVIGLDGDKTLWKFQAIDDTPPPAGDFPYAILGLDDWKITLPRSNDGDDRADEVYRDASKNDDSSDPSFTVYEDEFFFVSDNGVTFSCPVADGTPTTGNSSNTRSELREMPNNDNEDGWGASGSTVRELEFSARVLQTSSTRKLAFAQIHDYEEANWDDLIRIQIQSDTPNATVGDFGKIYILGDMAEGLSSEGIPSQPSDDRTIIDNYRLGDWMNIRMTFNNNTIRIYVNNVLKQTYEGADCARNYFKAGVYNQSVNNSSSGNGIVEFRSLDVTENF